jgi:transcriptional regulator with GAF, ATPase, and Fis domain
MSIGRAPDNDVRFDDRTVSRYHAVISQHDGRWHINDLGSRNTTLLNGERIVSACLSHMDEVHLGNVVLAFLDRGEDTPGPPADAQRRPGPEITQIIRLDSLPGYRWLSAARQDELFRQNQRLSHLLHLAELAASAKGLPALFGGMVESLRQALGAERVIPILEEPAGVLRPYLASSADFADSVAGLDVDAELLQRARREGPVVATGGRGRAANVACAPISVGARRLGLIYCDTSDPALRFTGEDLRYLFSICAAAAVAVQTIRDTERAAQRTRILRRQLEERYNMVGDSEPIKAVYRFIRKVAPTEAAVFICGESGTGKELAARAIHNLSRRCDGPLEVANCGAMPPTLIESELFGHVKGAFTGALAGRLGRFELADGGTLFLDEVVELPPQCQTKLLRVLEEGKIRRVGDTHDRSADVRLISATNRDPEEAIAQGRLRKDLFYRLDRLRLIVPPLRARGDDIQKLACYCLERLRRQCRRAAEAFDPAVMKIFMRYNWPGNVRELQNVVERMVILSEGPVLGADLIPEDLKAAARGGKAGGIVPLSEVEKRHILRAMRETGGNKARAAQLLGIDRTTLYAKLRRYAIDGGDRTAASKRV